jgi:thiamine biosynthesis lipoprotein
MIRTACVRELHYSMGTLLEITVWGPRARSTEAVRRAAARARRAERLFSAHDAHSILAEMNRLRRIPPAAPPPFARLVRRATAWRDGTGGAFDPGVPGRLDLGAIAKGYVVDQIARAFRRGGIRRALINFGQSSLYAIGRPPGLVAWPVVLRGYTPRSLAGGLLLRDAALSVSGTHRVDLSGREIGTHVVDPRTGRRLRQRALAAVMGPSAEAAEALSTALLVRGPGAAPLFGARRRYRGLYLSAGRALPFNGFAWYRAAGLSEGS